MDEATFDTIKITLFIITKKQIIYSVSGAILMALFKCEKYQTLEKRDLLLVLPPQARQILTLKAFFGRQNCVNY